MVNRASMRRLLAVTIAGLALSSCAGSDSASPSTESSTTASTVVSSTEPMSSSSVSQTTSSSVSQTTSSSVPTTVDGACVTVEFDNHLPAGWDPTLRPGQGDGSSLPGFHIEGPNGDFVKVFAGTGSVYGPTVGDALEIAGYPALVGSIEDGVGVRVNVDETCKIDLLGYGVAKSDMVLIAQSMSIVAH